MTGRRVGHVVASWPQQGGVADVIRALVVAANDCGDTATVFAWPGSASKADALLKLRRLPPGLEAALPELDVLVLHGVFTPGLALLSRRVRRRRPGLRLVAFPHDAYDDGLFSGRGHVKLAYWHAVERRYLAGVDMIQLTAPSHHDWLTRRGVSVPTQTRPLGIPVMPGSSGDHERPALASEGPRRLLFVGRWDIHEKGLDLLIAALGATERLRSAWTLRLVGPEVGSRDELVAMARAAGVTLDPVGWVEDLRAEMLAADLLVLPSRKEGFGLVALQALSVGLPVVLTDVSGLSEYLDEDAGWVSTAPTEESIRAALERALSRREVLAAAAAASQLGTDDRFSWPALHGELMGT